MAEQSFANHTKWAPWFHFFILPALLLNFGQSMYLWIHWGFPFHGLVGVITAFALIALALQARVFSLTVQNRVIRLEERLRLERLLPSDLKPRIGDFSARQLIALRFASDAELPELARKVLVDNITDGKAIKQMVQNWRADYLRV